MKHMATMFSMFGICLSMITGAQTEEFSLSVIIPCHYKHAQHLNNLIKKYEDQTVLPDEIVVSLSESHKASKNTINSIESKDWKFPVILLKTKEQAYAGKNRNIACKAAQGDIFLCQDADDLPHPQRVEIVKYFFKNYNIDHLMHQFSRAKLTNQYEIHTIPLIFPRVFEEVQYKAHKITNGNIAIASHVAKQIQWSDAPRAQDVRFNHCLYNYSDKGIVLFVPLLHYRQNLSTNTRRKPKKQKK